jgi:hypothetical protein
MADYDWFDRCDCNVYDGKGHELSCKKVYGWEKNRDWYDRGFGGHEYKVHCRGCGTFIADRLVHEKTCEHLKRLVENERYSKA